MAIIARGARLVFGYTAQGVPCSNTIHFLNSHDPNYTDLQGLAIGGLDFWNNSLAAITSSDVSLVRVEATSLYEDPQRQYVASTGLPEAGSVLQNAVPNNCALVVTLKTAFIGRSYRGRIYLPPPPLTQVDGNIVSSVHVAAVKAAFEDLNNEVSEFGWGMAVLSRQLDGVERSTPVLTAVTSVEVGNRIDTQRRRLSSEA